MDKNTSWKINKITESLNDLLQYKNVNYGDSALNPIKVFSKVDAVNSLCQRADDKISRIQNSENLRVNDLIDLMGYCVLICASKDWISFEEFKD